MAGVDAQPSWPRRALCSCTRRVYRATSPAGPFALLTPRPIPRSTFVAATPAPGTRAVYAVRAVDTSGNRSLRATSG